ncbi:MAG: hypothetical protein HZA77_00960 [Candidatus Schekmanbacteria bacterium]|nr:hypothetical protein [Candidatus Schekmanbacteria bacterium]
MNDTIYNMSSYFSILQGNRWTYFNKSDRGEKEVSYKIEGSEIFHGVEVPKKVQVDNEEEYFCTLVDPVYGVRDYKHHLGMAPNYLIYTPPTLVIPAKMRAGDIHYNTCHLFRHNSDGSMQDEGEFYDITVFDGVENVTVPAGKFDDCLKVTLTRDDVFSEIVINVVLTEWLAKGIGIVKSDARVNIYSPQGGEPFIMNSSDLLISAVIGGKKVGK